MELSVIVSQADCIGNPKNTSYPLRIVATSLEQLRQAVSKDHTFAFFKGNHRSNTNFERADTLPMDCDNDHSVNPEDWISPGDIAKALPDVPFIVNYSRNHMKEKGSTSARPRFHVIFPLSKAVTDAGEYSSLKSRIRNCFPFFDGNALDAGRFFFGTQEAKLSLHEGNTAIDTVLGSIEDEVKNSDETKAMTSGEIPEGKRNTTMAITASRLIKRHGDTPQAMELFLEESARCTPPLDTSELEQIWQGAQRFFHQKIERREDYVAPENFNNPQYDFGSSEEARKNPGHKELLSMEEFLNTIPHDQWLIKNFVLMGRNHLSYIFGESGCGKSFVALDMALSIAYGLEKWFFGKKIRQGKVLYFIGEGIHGFTNRIKAWQQEHGIREFSDNFYLFINPGVKLNVTGAIDHVMQTATELSEQGWHPDLIIIDTQARFTAGDENKQVDADAYISAFNSLGNSFDASVMVVHHTSKANGETLKGSVNLKGASDMNIRIEKTNDDRIRISHEKNKDGDELRDLFLEKKVIQLGVDEDLEPITSLVLGESTYTGKTPGNRESKESRQTSADLLLARDFIGKSGKHRGRKLVFTRLDFIDYLEKIAGFSHSKAVQQTHVPNRSLFFRLSEAGAICDGHEIGEAPKRGRDSQPQDFEWTFTAGLDEDEEEFLR